jgi:hypothetical protein
LIVVPAAAVETVTPLPAAVVAVVPFDELEQPLAVATTNPTVARTQDQRELNIVVHLPVYSDELLL